MYKFTLNLILLLLLLPFAETVRAQDPTPPNFVCEDCRDSNLFPEDVRNYVHNLITDDNVGANRFSDFSEIDVFIVLNGVGQHTLVDVNVLENRRPTMTHC